MPDVKETAIKIIQSLPEDSDWQDIMEEFYFRLKVDQGLREADEGKSIPFEEVKAEFGLL
jgi:predicted transcriptional regulator